MSTKTLNVQAQEEKLRALGQLKENWNSYGALPPGPIAIQLARTALEVMRELQMEPSRISPSPVDRGVMLTVRRGSRHGYMELYNSGKICCLIADDETQEEPDAWMVIAERQHIRTALEKILSYVSVSE